MKATESDSSPAGRRAAPARRWLAVTGVLLLALSVWPLGQLASRHLFAETIQFFAVAIVVPALVVLGARPAPRAGRLPFAGAIAVGALFAAGCLLWRLPPVLDALARRPLLRVPELASMLLAGVALWLQLVGSGPSAARLSRTQRAAVAAVPMWSVWAIGYVLGFANHPVIHAYDLSGSLGVVSDQELSAALTWAISGACFIPVIAVTMLGWLRDSGAPGPGPAEEQAVRGAMTVRGWTRAPRSR